MCPSQVRNIRHGVDHLVDAMEATDVTVRFFFTDA
jgi:hypothetical protein